MLRMLLSFIADRTLWLRRYLKHRFNSIDRQLAENHALLVSIDNALHPEREVEELKARIAEMEAENVKLQGEIDSMATGLGGVGDRLDALQEHETN